MSTTAEDLPLAALLSLPPEQRAAALRAAPGGVSEALVRLADEAWRLAFIDVAQALLAVEALVSVADELGDARGQARARRAQGHALAYAGRHQEALEVCRAGVERAEQANLPAEAAFVRLALLHPLGELGRYDEAVEAGEAARYALVEAGLPALAARADINLGGIYINRDEPGRALFHLDRARAALPDDPQMLGFIENNRGEALLLLSEFDQAEHAFRAALRAADAAGAALAAAIAEGNLADLAARRGLLQPALLHFERARQRLERDVAGSHHARLQAEQAEALLTLGLAEDAVAEFSRVLPALQEHGLTSEAGRARAGLGKALLRLGRQEQAAAILAQAVEDFTALGQTVGAAQVNTIQAELCLRGGQLGEARRLLEHASAALRSRPADLARVQLQQASLALAQNDAAAAADAVSRAITLVEELDIPPLTAEALHVRAALHGRHGRHDEAVEDLRLAVDHVERVRGSLQADRFRAAFLGDRLRLYEDLVLAKLARGGPGLPAAVFGAVERAKGRSLLDLLRGAAPPDDETVADDPAEHELRTKLARLRSELNALYSQLEDSRPEGGGWRVSLRQWRPALQARERELRSMEHRLWSLRGVENLFAPPVPLEELQSRLADDMTLLEFFIAGDQALALRVTRRDAALVSLGVTGRILREQVERLQFQIDRAIVPVVGGSQRQERLRIAYQQEARAIWQACLAPFWADLQETPRLVVVPHGPLHVAPFHALWDGQNYLLESHEVSYAPSGSVLAHHLSAAQKHSPDESSLIVGVADAAAPQINLEVRRVAECFPSAVQLQNSSASVEAVMQAAHRASVIHLACHGKFAGRSPLESGLRLSNRWLTVRDVYSMRLQAELVTLSGCDTGRNVVQAGDELLGLTRGFLAAGAASVLVSLWKLDDSTAAQLMSCFYESWISGRRAGLRKVAALRQAQLDAMRERPHPVYWGPFALVGSP